MEGLHGDCMLGLKSDLATSDGPARAEGAMDRVAAAVCRSRVGRTADAILFEGLAAVNWYWRAA